MQLSSLLATTGLVVSTVSAFLVPFPPESPAGSSENNDIVTALPITIEAEVPAIAETQYLNLSCPSCPVRIPKHHKDGKVRIKTDVESHLELEFGIDHASDYDRLMLNGFELYPNADLFRDTLSAKLVPDHPHTHMKHKKPGHRRHHEPFNEPLGFGLRAQPVALNTEDNLQLVAVDLQIIEVGNVFVNGIPNVSIKLIKTAEGGLMIGNIETTDSETIQGTPMDKQEECTTLLCKWRAVIMEQLARLRNHRPCPGMRHGEEAQEHPVPNLQHHGHRASWRHLLRNIATHILLPIAIGIVAGVTASVLGMMAGTAIVCLWRTFFRPPRRHHHRHAHAGASHKAVETDASVCEEKASLMAHQEEVEAPPAYVEEGVVEDKQPDHQL